MPTVYIINRSAHDFSDAKRYGELEFLTQGSVNRFSTGNMARIFTEKLAQSSPDDYLLPTGLSIMTAIACAVFALRHKRLNLLLWKNMGEKGSYIERVLDFSNLEEGD